MVEDVAEACEDRMEMLRSSNSAAVDAEQDPISMSSGGPDQIDDDVTQLQSSLAKLRAYINERSNEAAALLDLVEMPLSGLERGSSGDCAGVARGHLRQAWIELCGQKALREAEMVFLPV